MFEEEFHTFWMSNTKMSEVDFKQGDYITN